MLFIVTAINKTMIFVVAKQNKSRLLLFSWHPAAKISLQKMHTGMKMLEIKLFCGPQCQVWWQPCICLSAVFPPSRWSGALSVTQPVKWSPPTEVWGVSSSSGERQLPSGQTHTKLPEMQLQKAADQSGILAGHCCKHLPQTVLKLPRLSAGERESPCYPSATPPRPQTVPALSLIQCQVTLNVKNRQVYRAVKKLDEAQPN